MNFKKIKKQIRKMHNISGNSKSEITLLDTVCGCLILAYNFEGENNFICEGLDYNYSLIAWEMNLDGTVQISKLHHFVDSEDCFNDYLEFRGAHYENS